MKTIIQYLDDLKEKTGSDYATAKCLMVTKEAISKIRKRGQMSDETAMKIADELEIDRTEVLIAAVIARSEGEVKRAWVNASKRFGIAASLVMITTLNYGISDSYGKSQVIDYNSNNIHYAKL